MIKTTKAKKMALVTNAAPRINQTCTYHAGFFLNNLKYICVRPNQKADHIDDR